MYLPPNIEEKQAIDAYFVNIAVQKKLKRFLHRLCLPTASSTSSLSAQNVEHVKKNKVAERAKE